VSKHPVAQQQWWDEYGHMFAAQQEVAEGALRTKAVAVDLGR